MTANRVKITVDESVNFLHWETVFLDYRRIGCISRNMETDLDYYFRAYSQPIWAGRLEYEDEFCGYADNLTGAHNLAQAYANHLIGEGF
jgi:hypothetical protein